MPKKPLPKGPSISAMPEKGLAEKVIDFASPVPLDKAYYANTPKDKIFMDIISKAALEGLGGKVIGKGLGIVGRKIGKAIDKMPQPKRNVIKNDPYGLAEGPSDRRVFLDKLLGNTTKRAKKESNRLWEVYESTEPKFQPGRGYVEAAPREVREQAFNEFANFGKPFDEKYGVHSAVNLPEGFYLDFDTQLMEQLGRISPKGKGIWDHFRKLTGLDKRMEEIGIRPSKGFQGK